MPLWGEQAMTCIVIIYFPRSRNCWTGTGSFGRDFPASGLGCGFSSEIHGRGGYRNIRPFDAAPQPWFGDAEESRRAVRQYNEACARLKADYPGKFLFCASLPLPDVDAAIKEAVYALDTLGADGIKLHLLHVLSGTDLAEDYAAGNFETMTLDAYLSVLEDCLRVLRASWSFTV